MAVLRWGADMPVVISLLNSYAGLAACGLWASLLGSQILIISGALDGSSNSCSRSDEQGDEPTVANIALRRVRHGARAGPPASQLNKGYNEATVEDAAAVLKASQSIIFIPGYGMAVSQAQRFVHDLAASLERREIGSVPIHPVAGRGMNVLLARKRNNCRPIPALRPRQGIATTLPGPTP